MVEKKGSSRGRKRFDTRLRKMIAEADRVAATKPAFFLETLAGDVSLQKEMDRQWRVAVYMIDSDLRRIRAGATANIPDSFRRGLRRRVREIEAQVARAGESVKLVLEHLALVETGMRYARAEFEFAPIIPPAAKKKSRSQTAPTATAKSQ